MALFSMAIRSSEDPPLKPGIVRDKVFVLGKVLKSRGPLSSIELMGQGHILYADKPG